MPKALGDHQAVSFDKDVVVIGGNSDGYQSSLYRLTCQNKACEWKTMTQQLKVARAWFVTMLMPDELVDCSGK